MHLCVGALVSIWLRRNIASFKFVNKFSYAG
jgi:hypothetical protein